MCLNRLKRWLAAEPLQTRAQETGFMKRKPKAITPLHFVESALLLVTQSVVSLSRWAVLLGLVGHCTVAKQSLWERLGKGAVALLQQTLGLILAERIQVRAGTLPHVLRSFQRVLIQDSTLIPVCPGLAKVFPGSRNQRGTKLGQLRIQAVYELLTQRFLSFQLSGFNRNDQAAAHDILSLVQPGDLVVRDLGYYVLETFQHIAAAGAAFLSRLRSATALFDPQTQRQLDLLRILRRQGHWEQAVLVGHLKLPARLVAIKLPADVAAERRRRAKQNRDKRCRPNATHLALLDWAIFITNVDATVLSARAVARVYGLRWRIETVFKAWKSHFRITEVPKGSAEQLLCIIYARLIFLTVMMQFCTGSWQAQLSPRSLLKTAALLGDFFLPLFLEAWGIRLSEALLLQVAYHGRYDRRKRQNFCEILMNLS